MKRDAITEILVSAMAFVIMTLSLFAFAAPAHACTPSQCESLSQEIDIWSQLYAMYLNQRNPEGMVEARLKAGDAIESALKGKCPLPSSADKFLN